MKDTEKKEFEERQRIVAANRAANEALERGKQVSHPSPNKVKITKGDKSVTRNEHATPEPLRTFGG